MLAPHQVANLKGLQADVDVPLSLLEAFIGLAFLLGPALIRWWKKRRDTPLDDL